MRASWRALARIFLCFSAPTRCPRHCLIPLVRRTVRPGDACGGGGGGGEASGPRHPGGARLGLLTCALVLASVSLVRRFPTGRSDASLHRATNASAAVRSEMRGGITPRMDLECFKHHLPFGNCCGQQQPVNGVSRVTIAHVMDQVVRGNAECPGCHKRSDMREAVRHFNFAGQPEALFGLQIWTGMLEWTASDVPRIEVDVRCSALTLRCRESKHIFGPFS